MQTGIICCHTTLTKRGLANYRPQAQAYFYGLIKLHILILTVGFTPMPIPNTDKSEKYNAIFIIRK